MIVFVLVALPINEILDKETVKRLGKEPYTPKKPEDDFTEEEFKTLEVRKVRGAKSNTEYTLGSNDNGNYLKATANNAASGLGKEIKIDINLILN